MDHRATNHRHGGADYKMQYRREIDGLRSIAVLPVILCHAEMPLFKGGFVGVDIFFVISGYLISTIIMTDLDAKNFSVKRFYERRIRRIMPALFLVMLLTTPFAYFWMMPEDFKNYGQSLVATTLFSNNILLAITSGYWASDSAFKPLLHTWSLGVEEQYYVFFPLILAITWKYARRWTFGLLVLALIVSFCLALWGIAHTPSAAFYLLPTRGWELLVGALTAYGLKYCRQLADSTRSVFLRQAASLSGLAMITFAVLVFNDNYPSPGAWTLLPVVGASLTIIFAREGTVSYNILSSRAMSGIGLISYSLYLWHQPVFALARIYSQNPVGKYTYLALIFATFILAYLTWKYVESPFRTRERIRTRDVIISSACASLLAIGFGVYLNKTYGMYWRVFNHGEKVADLDKRIYNERAFKYKTGNFAGNGGLKIFVVGNSFGRDFVNMTREAYDVRKLDISYSDKATPCIENSIDPDRSLYEQADVIVFASGYTNPNQIANRCVARDIAWAKTRKKNVFYIGTKYFGQNLNWIARLPQSERADQYNPIPEHILEEQNLEISQVPYANFISLLNPVMRNGKVPITDHQGKMISTDHMHVTKYGAIYFGERVIKFSEYGAIIRNNISKGRNNDPVY